MKIDHPQVYLYSYQLSKKSGTDPNSIWTWADNLQQKFNVNNNSPDDFSQANCRQPLLSKAKKFNFSPGLNGSLRCCRLHDSEGILARVGSPEDDDNKDLSLEIFKTFNPDHVLVPVNDSKWLGQTILITYKLKTLVTPTQKLADEIVQNLFGDKPSAAPRSTKLFGSPIFEYSSLDNQQQIFVYALNDLSEKNLQKTLQSVFELFYYRHKIVKAFIDSREFYRRAQKFYEIVENNIKDLQQKTKNDSDEKLLDLGNLKTDIKQLLQDSLLYQETLQKLDNSDNTIAINVYNYQQKLLEISDKCHLLPEELTTFSFFADKTTPHCQRQIQGDLGYFKHGTDLINTAIASIRGIVEIEQAESDRQRQETEKKRDQQLQERDQKLQNTIQYTIQSVGVGVGVGVGIGGIVATSYPLIDKQWNLPSVQNPLLPPHPFVMAIISSFLLGGGLGRLAWHITRKRLEAFSISKQELKSSEEERSLPDKDITNKQQL